MKQTPTKRSTTAQQAEATTESLWLNGAIHRLQGVATSPEEPDQLPRQLSSRYLLLDIIGQGTFGVVYKAEDRQLARTVAVKVLRDRYLQTVEARERFAREASQAGQIEHENVARVYDSHVDAHQAYLVMEYVEGRSLADLRSEYSLPDARVACELVRKATEGLAAAHRADLVHRDVKSANLLVTEDLQRVCLTDFGLAISPNGIPTEVAGSLAYMSPEHLDREQPIDARADIYSMGVVLYELLTGARPFDGTGETLRLQILFHPSISAGERNSRLPRDLVTITDKCLRKNPAERYQTATELSQDLQAWLENRPIEARPVGRLARTLKWARREPVSAALSTALTCGILAAVVFATYSVTEIIDQRNRAKASAEFAEQLTDQFHSIVDFSVQQIDSKLRNRPGTQQLRMELLDSIADELQQQDSTLSSAPGFSLRLVNVHLKTGEIFQRIGRSQEAEDSYQDAVQIASKLYEAPDSAVTQPYIDSLLSLAELQDVFLAKTDAAKSNYVRALKLMDAHDEIPELVFQRLILFRCLAELEIKQRRLDEARSWLDQALSLLETPSAKQLIPQDEFARTYEAVGVLCCSNAEFAEGAEWLSQSLPLREAVHRDAPEDVDAHQSLIGCLTVLARAEKNSLRFTSAYQDLQRAVQESQKLAVRFSGNHDLQRSYAVALSELGQLLQACGDYTNGEENCRQSNEIIRELLAQDCQNHELRWDLAVGAFNLGELYFNSLKPSKARDEFEAARKLLLEIPRQVGKEEQLATIDQQLGMLEISASIPAASVSQEMLIGLDGIVIGHCLMNRLAQGELEEASALAGKVHCFAQPSTGKLNQFDRFNIACMLAECHHRLTVVDDSTASPPVTSLQQTTRENAIELIVQLHHEGQLDASIFGPGLHRTGSLKTLHSDPRMQNILNEVGDPFLSFEEQLTPHQLADSGT